jgi:hypothetical protein
MTDTTAKEDLKSFLLVLRQALLMIVRWIEKKYNLEKTDRKKYGNEES